MYSQEFFARFLRVTTLADSPVISEQAEARRLTEPLAKSTINSTVRRLVIVNHNNSD